MVPLGGGARTLAQSSVRHTTRLFFFLSLFLAFFFFGPICFIRFSALAAVFFFFFSLSSTTALHYHSLRVLSRCNGGVVLGGGRERERERGS